MISKPMLTTAWLAAAGSGDEFVAAINCQVFRASWHYALTATHEKGVLVVTRYAKPLGVVGSPVVLRDVLMEWRDLQSTSRHPETRRALEEIITGLRPVRFPFAVVELGVDGRPSSMSQFFQDLAAHGKIALILWHKRVYAYAIPLTWLASYTAECGNPEPKAREWLTQVLNWTWAHEIEPKPRP